MPMSASVSVLCTLTLSLPCKIDMKSMDSYMNSPRITTCGTVRTTDKQVSVGTPLPPFPPRPELTASSASAMVGTLTTNTPRSRCHWPASSRRLTAHHRPRQAAPHRSVGVGARASVLPLAMLPCERQPPRARQRCRVPASAASTGRCNRCRLCRRRRQRRWSGA